jgi:hypothetical protein
LLLIATFPLRGDLCGSGQAEISNDPPDPEGDIAKIWVEIDWHSRVTDPENLEDPHDLATYVEEWRGSLLEGGTAGCSHRFNEAEAEFDVKVERSQEVNWTSKNLVDVAFAAGYTADEAGVVTLLKTLKTQKTNLPNLYLLAGEYFNNPSSSAYPTAAGRYLAFGRGYDFEETTECHYATEIGYPVAVVFVSEVEKFVDDMNEYTNTWCHLYYYDLKRSLANVVAHELFHELFISSPYEYSAYPYTYCHDGDTGDAACKCIMNTPEPGIIVDLILNQPPDCAGVSAIVDHWHNPCMERAHDADGCSLAEIINFN